MARGHGAGQWDRNSVLNVALALNRPIPSTHGNPEFSRISLSLKGVLMLLLWMPFHAAKLTNS